MVTLLTKLVVGAWSTGNYLFPKGVWSIRGHVKCHPMMQEHISTNRTVQPQVFTGPRLRKVLFLIFLNTNDQLDLHFTFILLMKTWI